jgi:hypothetical protein
MRLKASATVSHAVIAHHHHLDLGIDEKLRAALPLLLEGQPAIMRVDDMAVEEHRRILVDRRQARVGERRQHRGVDRMDMHDAARVADIAMDGAVQPPRRRIGRVRTGERIRIIGIDHQEVARLDAREMHLVGIHQELRAVVVDGQREMIGHRLVHVEPRRPAKGTSEIDALLIEGQVGQRFLLQAGDAHPKILRFRQECRDQPMPATSFGWCRDGYLTLPCWRQQRRP